MFLCDFAMGKMYKPNDANKAFPVRGYDSTWVDAGTCSVQNHEAIVYSIEQVNLKYLVEFN